MHKKLPVPLPSALILSVITGLPVVFQHIPRSVIEEPPSSVIFPPLCADVEVTFEISVVVIIIFPLFVVKLVTLPYAVPVSFVAKARK